jgi:hypothetical protein
MRVTAFRDRAVRVAARGGRGDAMCRPGSAHGGQGLCRSPPAGNAMHIQALLLLVAGPGRSSPAEPGSARRGVAGTRSGTSAARVPFGGVKVAAARRSKSACSGNLMADARKFVSPCRRPPRSSRGRATRPATSSGSSACRTTSASTRAARKAAYSSLPHGVTCPPRGSRCPK